MTTVKNQQGRVVPTTLKQEEFYRECMTAIAKIAREKYGDKPRVLDMIALLGRACGMMICAAYPNERDLARQTAIANIDHSVANFAAGEPSPMTKQ